MLENAEATIRHGADVDETFIKKFEVFYMMYLLKIFD